MSKVTTKLQVTIPRAVAKSYGIEPGDEVTWVPAGEIIRLVPHGRHDGGRSTLDRLELFDQTTIRIANCELTPDATSESSDRGWTREELYNRGSPR
ncbi:MAG: hypothetical protein A2289_24120 [Deltaproteobacteria bacterium RIFOXYA12_FULL_58_15]|nr:MAG: hypothetical protein A2289_24120 [Deltaproteobacteria bacterium RIFOXYA12_FULL_58_15]OGR08588.1 MAG: hypothetical protein A2341_14090 [Deltaproteobacteria bacterium RIFOXYB12_FULL_58_9]